jgi:hypothetical protein
VDIEFHQLNHALKDVLPELTHVYRHTCINYLKTHHAQVDLVAKFSKQRDSDQSMFMPEFIPMLITS